MPQGPFVLSQWQDFTLVCVCVYKTFSSFTLDGYLCYFYILVIMNNAAVNMECRYAFKLDVYFLLRSGAVGLYDSSVF